MPKRVMIAAVTLVMLAAVLWWWWREPRPEPRAARAVSSSIPAPRPVHVRRASRGARTRPGSSVSSPAAASNPKPTSRVEQLHTSVLQRAVRDSWLSTDERGTPCPPDRVRIVYTAPDDLAGYTKGAYFEPLGPSPKEENQEVNGLLLCEGSTFLYLGFEAYFRSDRGQWDVYPFPSVE